DGTTRVGTHTLPIGIKRKPLVQDGTTRVGTHTSPNRNQECWMIERRSEPHPKGMYIALQTHPLPIE
ncbi:31180_t:CDS:2, partial [Gigaspora margarita]